MFASIEDFSRELGLLKDKFLPDSKIEVTYKRIDKASLRILIDTTLFIDVYDNTENNRYDFSLIKDNKRIFGYDNLGGWHCHPLNNPDEHIECQEPSALKNILKEITAVIHSL